MVGNINISITDCLLELVPGDFFNLQGVSTTQEEISGICVSKRYENKNFHCGVLARVDASYDGQYPPKFKTLVFFQERLGDEWFYKTVEAHEDEKNWQIYQKMTCLEFKIKKA